MIIDSPYNQNVTITKKYQNIHIYINMYLKPDIKKKKQG